MRKQSHKYDPITVDDKSQLVERSIANRVASQKRKDAKKYLQARAPLKGNSEKEKKRPQGKQNISDLGQYPHIYKYTSSTTNSSTFALPAALRRGSKMDGGSSIMKQSQVEEELLDCGEATGYETDKNEVPRVATVNIPRPGALPGIPRVLKGARFSQRWPCGTFEKGARLSQKSPRGTFEIDAHLSQRSARGRF